MKSEFRRFFLNLRREMDEDYIKNAGKEIESKLFDSLCYKNSKSIFVYVSKGKEIDTRNIINTALSDGKEVYIPKISKKVMKACRLYSIDDLKIGVFDIMTSPSNEFIKNPDLTITPGLSFDRDKNRLGYGGGYYDRFFDNSNTYKLGLFISDFEAINLPIEKTDIKLDKIITDKEII